MMHRHDWVILLENASAVYEKQEGQRNAFYCEGQIQKCLRGGEMRLIPHDPSLRVVEVEFLQAAVVRAPGGNLVDQINAHKTQGGN